MSVGSKVTRVRGVFVGVSVGVHCDRLRARSTDLNKDFDIFSMKFPSN